MTLKMGSAFMFGLVWFGLVWLGFAWLGSGAGNTWMPSSSQSVVAEIDLDNAAHSIGNGAYLGDDVEAVGRKTYPTASHQFRADDVQ